MRLVVSEIKKRSGIMLCVLLYVISFDLAYIFGVSELYGYTGLTFYPNWTKCAISFTVIFIAILWLPEKMENVSSHLFFILFIINYLPTASYYWLNDKSTIYFIELSFCYILIEMLMASSTKQNLRINIPNANFLISTVLVFYMVSTLYLIMKNGGLKLSYLDIVKASSSREKGNNSSLDGYLMNWCGRSLMPLFLAYFSYLKKKKWVIIVSVLQIGLYLTFGFKTFLFSVAYLVLISLVLKYGWKFWMVFPMIFCGMNIIAVALYKLGVDRMLLFLFPYRTLTVPAGGQFEYYEYFSKFEKLHFGGSFIGNILGVPYRYSKEIGFVIVEYFYGTVSNGNTGIFSYAFADNGFPGMILAALILAMIFKCVDITTKNIPVYITVGAMSYQMVCLNDTNLMINLNTGGILITMLMLIIINSFFYKHSQLGQIEEQCLQMVRQ